MAVLSILGPFQGLIAFLGSVILLFCLFATLYHFLKHVYVYFLAEPLGQTVDFKSLGEWAVVTGATDGIGKGYALDLARRGCNIILIARNKQKLADTAKEIEQFKVRTLSVIVDFSDDESIYDKVKSELEGLEIGVLINNVGIAYPEGMELFHEIPGGEKTLLDILRVNCIAQTLMTRIVLPQMVKRRKGVVVHISSGAGHFPMPLLTVYSASKAYNDFFGRALAQEYEDHGIISQVIQPWAVISNLNRIEKTSLFVLDALPFARSCLNTVGFFSRTNGHPAHSFQNWVLATLPASLSPRLLKAFLLKMQRMEKEKAARKAKTT